MLILSLPDTTPRHPEAAAKRPLEGREDDRARLNRVFSNSLKEPRLTSSGSPVIVAPFFTSPRTRGEVNLESWSVADLRVIVAGAGGRMGRTLVKAVADTPGMTVVGATEAAGSPLIGEDAGVLAGLPASGVRLTADAAPLLGEADAVLDFTIPNATVALTALAAKAHCAHIIGTTGLEPADMAEIKQAARETVVVQSGNMSLGVNLVAALVKRVAATLGETFDIEILEMHHNKKIDAPSGTALLLGEAAAAGRKIELAKRSERGRDGITGARKAGDIGFASLRGGTNVGEHHVIFAGPAERIELVHRAEDRMLFARGALHAALWSRGRKPGFYSMADVLGLADM
jgi:4-hydroxy-tetrahydrodipicolinate reductase